MAGGIWSCGIIVAPWIAGIRLIRTLAGSCIAPRLKAKRVWGREWNSPQAEYAKSSSSAALSHVLSVLREPRQYLDCSASVESGPQDQQYAARAGVLGLCDPLRRLSACGGLDRGQTWSAPHLGGLLCDRGSGHGAHRRGEWSCIAVRGAPGSGFRGRRRLPHGDPRYVKLDSPGELGLRTGDRPLVFEDRQRGDTALDGRAAGIRVLARLLRHSGSRELPLGLGVGLVFPQRSARTSSHFSGGTGDTAFPHRCGPLRGCAVAAACAACTPRDDRGFLLRLDAVVVSELGTGVLLRELPPGSASVGHVLVGSLAGRSHWRHRGWRGERPASLQNRQPDCGAPLRHRSRLPRRFCLPASRGADPRSHCHGDLPFAGFLFRRTHCGADLVGSDGHRASLCRYRKRHDELRLCSRGTRFSVEFRLPRRSNGKLGGSVSCLNHTFAWWGCFGPPLAAGSALCELMGKGAGAGGFSENIFLKSSADLHVVR